MTIYKVTNNSNYPKSVGGIELQPSESKEVELTEEEVADSLRGLVFEELSDSEEESVDDEEGSEEEDQESKPEDKENKGDE